MKLQRRMRRSQHGRETTMPPSVYSRPDTCATYALPAEDLGDWPRSSSREWIVTNGIGGYASGTLSGANTRCYHGFLTAALDPPGGRTVLSAVIEETVQFEGQSYPLSSTEW